jgi:hypothetical protein
MIYGTIIPAGEIAYSELQEQTPVPFLRECHSVLEKSFAERKSLMNLERDLR